MMNEMEITDMAKNPGRSTSGINATNGVLYLMDKGKDLHQESEEARWQRFHSRYLVHDANPDDGKKLSKTLLKITKKWSRPQPI